MPITKRKVNMNIQTGTYNDNEKKSDEETDKKNISFDDCIKERIDKDEDYCEYLTETGRDYKRCIKRKKQVRDKNCDRIAKGLLEEVPEDIAKCIEEPKEDDKEYCKKHYTGNMIQSCIDRYKKITERGCEKEFYSGHYTYLFGKRIL